MKPCIKEFTSAKGYTELEKKIESALSIRNTRFYPTYVEKLSQAVLEWDNHIIKCLKYSDNITFWDVGSNAAELSMSNIRAGVDSDKKISDRYKIGYYPKENFHSINFIIIDFTDEKQPTELWIGWHIDDNRNLREGKCYQTFDKRLIQIYRDWHIRLMRKSGQNLS